MWDAEDLVDRRRDVIYVVELGPRRLIGLDALGPRDRHRITRTAEVRGDQLRVMERRVTGPRPAGVVHVVGFRTAEGVEPAQPIERGKLLLHRVRDVVLREQHSSVRYGYVAVADGVDAMHQVVREQLMLGASQIKLAAGGGVSSDYDPIDVTEYTKAEIEAAEADAENWGTYVTVHVYTARAIRLAVDAGVKCIDHGQLIDEPTMKLLADNGIWLSIQPFLDDEDRIPTAPGSENERKYKQVTEGTDRAYTLARKYKVKLAFGINIQFNPNGAKRQAFYLPKLTKWFTPAEALKQATADNAELLTLSGPRNPYPGKLGVVEEGALADLRPAWTRSKTTRPGPIPIRRSCA